MFSEIGNPYGDLQNLVTNLRKVLDMFEFEWIIDYSIECFNSLNFFCRKLYPHQGLYEFT